MDNPTLRSRPSNRLKVAGLENESSVSIDHLICAIAKSLVDHPEAVEVNTIAGRQTTVLELRVAKEDVGKVIGKQGRTAQALRILLGAVSSKIKKRMVLEIIE
jgi:predicted RNA-binding protein YlqC (UPF0109 family)